MQASSSREKVVRQNLTSAMIYIINLDGILLYLYCTRIEGNMRLKLSMTYKVLDGR